MKIMKDHVPLLDGYNHLTENKCAREILMIRLSLLLVRDESCFGPIIGNFASRSGV